MKKSGGKSGKAGSIPPDITRHCTKLSPVENQDVVGQLADLIVDFVKMEGIDSVKNRAPFHASAERSIPEPLRDGHTEKKKRQ